MPESMTEVCGMRGKEFEREMNDCTVVALAKVVGIEYKSSYEILKAAGRKNRQGFPIRQLMGYLSDSNLYSDEGKRYGFQEVTAKPSYLRTLKQTARQFPGRYVVTVKAGYAEGHAFAMIDGIITDSIVNHLPITGMWKLWRKEKANEAGRRFNSSRTVGVSSLSRSR